jgi:hypothetical protein
MSSIILDQSAAAKLRECLQVTVLRDPSGKVVGYFEPPQLHVYKEGEIPEFVEEALKKPRENGEKLTTDEVLRRLRNQP